MMNISAMELLIGVAVENIKPRLLSPRRSNTTLLLMNRSSARDENALAMPGMRFFLVKKNKFLNKSASSTKIMSIPRSSKGRIPLSRSTPVRDSSFVSTALAALDASRTRFLSEIPNTASRARSLIVFACALMVCCPNPIRPKVECVTMMQSQLPVAARMSRVLRPSPSKSSFDAASTFARGNARRYSPAKASSMWLGTTRTGLLAIPSRLLSCATQI